jgi:hypothetical protein
VADDDVRYDPAGLRRICDLLDETDLVRPRNYFDPRPWHAVWDTGRSSVVAPVWLVERGICSWLALGSRGPPRRLPLPGNSHPNRRP